MGVFLFLIGYETGILIEYIGIWESIYNPSFNYGEFAIIKSQAGLNSYKLSVKDWLKKQIQLV